MTALLASVCLEGLGRKFMPWVPSVLFYFMKDAVLLVGLVRFGLAPNVKRTMRRLMGGFTGVAVAAVFFTVMQCFNPEHTSLAMGVVGLRAYWLWFLAPPVIASALADARDMEHSLRALAVMALVVALFATLQFALPSTDAFNTYALYEGRSMNDVDIVGTTGRVRVSSTFSYLSGFVIFTEVVPVLLLSLGMELARGLARTLCLVATVATLVTMPMSGSRGPILVGLASLVMVLKGSGAFGTRQGRRIIAGAALAGVVAVVVAPEAIQGVTDRFQRNEDETAGRVLEVLNQIPVVAAVHFDYPFLGIGTGLQQNAATALGVKRGGWAAENEPHRILIEEGLLGFALVWMCRLAMVVGLVRAARALKKVGRGATSGLALALAAQAFLIPLAFDHVAQALYMITVGFVLHAASAIPSLGQVQTRPRAMRGAGSMPLAAPIPTPFSKVV